eukprot:263295_1
MMAYMHELVQSKQEDPEFSKLWNQMGAHRQIYNRYVLMVNMFGMHTHPGLTDLVKLNSNQFANIPRRKPLGIYALLSKINFGVPQNMGVVCGDSKTNYACTVFATTD